MNEEFIVIAVDGGAASGKSSSSRLVAERLNLLHADTGSHYRALTHALLEAGLEVTEGTALDAFLSELELGSLIEGRQALVVLNGQCFDSATLRRAEINEHVSPVAALPSVRTLLKSYQQGLASLAQEKGFAGLIMEGRDIGSVIFPEATLKVHLEADIAVRESRRAAEGQRDAIAARDQIDSSRPTAPLRLAEGAVAIDTAAQSLESVVDLICKLAGERHRRLSSPR
jgi:CMP/dCMP kinase